jgi:Family of unknown function (DUF6152)
MKSQMAIIVGAALLVVAVSTYAHHPFSSEYDWKQPVTLTGTVSKIEWSNPHAFLYIDGKDQNGEMKHWTLEMGSPSALTRAGWTRNLLKMGDQVTVDGWMSKTKKDHANVKSVKMADGRELSGASSIGDTSQEKKPISN